MSTTQIQTLFDMYMQLRPLSHGTKAIYTQAARHLTAALPGRDAGDIGPLDAQRTVIYLTGVLNSPASVNLYVRAFKAVWNWSVASEILPKNVFKTVKFLRDKRPGKDVYRTPELDRLLAACPNDRWRLIVALAATTGMRRGEVLNLTVSEIDYLGGVITLAPKADTPTTWQWDLKDAESRKVPITAMTEQLLLRLHAELPDGQPYLCLTPQRYRRLMGRRAAGTLDYTARKCPEVNFLRTFQGICRRAGVVYKTFHALRGSCLTLLADNGLPPHQVQAVAGHADIRTTFGYYVKPDDTLNAVRNNTYIGR